MRLPNTCTITIQPCKRTDIKFIDGQAYHREVPSFEARLEGQYPQRTTYAGYSDV